jgi:hypothetical protein
MSEIVHNIYKIRCHHLSLFFSLRLFALFAVKKNARKLFRDVAWTVN